MKLNLLGTAGVSPIPRPTCDCRLCAEARQKGIPYKRTGPSLYVYDIALLFDLPEEVKEQLNREEIKDVKHVIITHWHPDHTLGIRVLEQLNWNFAEKKPYHESIKVYISKYQYEMFKKLSCGGFLDYYQQKGIVELSFLEHKQKILLGTIEIEPILIKKTKGFYYIISDLKSNKKMVYAPCEYHGLEVDPGTRDIDLFIAHNLFWEDKSISPRTQAPEDEDSFEMMLRHSKEMGAKRIVLTHIEETFQLSHDDLNRVLPKKYPGYNINAGYDGQIFEL